MRGISGLSAKKAILLLSVCYVCMTAMRLSAPYDLDAHAQDKQGLYILDVVQNGSVFLPMERGEEPATKPPLYNWIGAGFSLLWGDVTDFTVKLPAIISGLGVVVLTFLLGERCFSRTVGLFSGLILMLNFHFVRLSCTARTDMMQCFFITLALYLFLRSFQDKGKDRGIILAFAAMGLGSITKSPVALLLPLLVVVVYLGLKKELWRLRSKSVLWGSLIWLAIVLGWFIPALIDGGREFFDIVIYDEMLNRFFGVGTRSAKTQPFYYLVSHFFGKFLPWSLFMPSVVLHAWKTRRERTQGDLLFPLVWFFTVLFFFSLSKGKRSDYILPLYPAASVAVAHFWCSLSEQGVARGWLKQARGISLFYLSASAVGVVCLLLLVFVPGVLGLAKQVAHDNMDDAEFLRNSLKERTVLFLATSLPFGAAALLGIMAAIKKAPKHIFAMMAIVSALYLITYFQLLSPEATRLDGPHKREFCSKVAGLIESGDSLKFSGCENSVLFYLGKNEPLLSEEEAGAFLDTSDKAYVITMDTLSDKISSESGSEFEVLLKSEYLFENEACLVLLGKAHK